MQQHPALTAFKVSWAILALSAATAAQAQTIGDLNEPEDTAIITPEKQPEPVHAAQIDTEKYELGVFIGALNVEDFNANGILGLGFTYHINETFIAQVNLGQSTISKATFEEDSDFLTDDDRKFQYLEVTGGYKVLSGRSFWGSNTKMNSDIYLIAGLGQTAFADNQTTSFVFGGSYRTVITDWMTLNIDIKDHVFNRDFIGDNKTTHNTELSLGINALF